MVTRMSIGTRVATGTSKKKYIIIVHVRGERWNIASCRDVVHMPDGDVGDVLSSAITSPRARADSDSTG